MAARATRSPSLAVRLGTLSLSHDALLLLAADALTDLPEGHAEAVITRHKRSHLLALSHDALGVIVDGLADPLQPVVAVAFSSTCKGLRTPLRAALEVLQEWHEKAVALCDMVMDRRLRRARELPVPEDGGIAWLRTTDALYWEDKDLTADNIATLGFVLRTNSMPRLRSLWLNQNAIGDAELIKLFDGLGSGAAPSLETLRLDGNQFGPTGAEALAAALQRGAMPMLQHLHLDFNPIGKQGMAALATPLRKLPALKELHLDACGICDEGMASLVANLGEKDFEKLEDLDLGRNELTEKGCGTLVSALDDAAMPSLAFLYLLLAKEISSGKLARAAAAREIDYYLKIDSDDEQDDDDDDDDDDAEDGE